MIETGKRNAEHGAEAFGFRDLAGVHWNLGAPQLYEHALSRGEAQVAAGGPLVADTGVHTGRSPKDKHIVRDATTAPLVWWDNNNAMTPEQFETLLSGFPRPCAGQDAVRARPLRRRGSGSARARPRLHRACLAFAVHSQSVDPSRG